jgi:hypothetical protein
MSDKNVELFLDKYVFQTKYGAATQPTAADK